ncbi:uncharacterized protein THITE_2083863 [Thermothielavioides terrestris NRRL 8126]|uniref:NmrA-like domain-containing protein n=1 Tax=Thermothielavioides terrestris (strain ATCC 38088 / NRRL 8126) TaxID=578455 RepID=G2QXL5_THETT|nr:uncharacterized protein THITE_2083863 [Thermothielavioides terrestris NRRL 8126]AEO62333.1 hypothetical protein THITE_2083863 [Thermothielavioides terrestris NRRL 8126]
MAPTILVAGVTGNTGRGVVDTLPALLQASSTLSDHRIIALTRSLQSPAAQRLARVPGVQVLEHDWADITADWLRQHGVVRAFIASHNQPDQFAAESGFHLAALQAGVRYVVRISTAAANVRPDCATYYARTHWAVETLLGAPEFAALQWTSLRPNLFANFALMTAAGLVKQFRQTGKQEQPLRLLLTEHAPIGIVDPWEVGVVAAHLLAQEDPSTHNRARYVVSGPEDITGAGIVQLVEQHIGTRVESVKFGDSSAILEAAVAAAPQWKSLIMTMKDGLKVEGKGKWEADTTSKEVLELAAPKRTPADVLKALLED